jgi:hypothetical protein
MRRIIEEGEESLLALGKRNPPFYPEKSNP